jgi:predicted nucleotidyltransferase
MELAKGVSYATARQIALERFGGREAAAVLSQPNNILAVEYCKALQRFGSSIRPVTVERIGAGHDSATASQEIASASLLRRKICNGESFRAFCPRSAGRFIRELEKGLAPLRMD